MNNLGYPHKWVAQNWLLHDQALFGRSRWLIHSWSGSWVDGSLEIDGWESQLFRGCYGLFRDGRPLRWTRSGLPSLGQIFHRGNHLLYKIVCAKNGAGLDGTPGAMLMMVHVSLHDENLVWEEVGKHLLEDKVIIYDRTCKETLWEILSLHSKVLHYCSEQSDFGTTNFTLFYELGRGWAARANGQASGPVFTSWFLCC